MSTLLNVALTPRGVTVDASELSAVAAALSIQVARDFSPIWDIDATVSAFAAPADVPLGYWPIYIEDPSKLPQGAGGVHLDKRNQPYSLIEFGPQWSLDASHELLEMLVDPSGNKVQTNPLLAQAVALGQPDQQVQYIVEVCDPVEDAQYGYQINGVLVSDFFTPHFYDAVSATGVRYDFTGALTGPRQVLTNGYISWLEANGAAMQLLNFIGPDGKLDPQINNLSQNADFQRVLDAEGLRPAVDRVTNAPRLLSSLTAEHLAELNAKTVLARNAAQAQSTRLHTEINAALRPDRQSY